MEVRGGKVGEYAVPDGFGADTEVDTGGGRAGLGFSNPSCVHFPPK